MIQLEPKHHPTAVYENEIRWMLPVRFPQVVSYFQAADIVSQVLNFGLPAAIDVQISGFDLNSDYAIAAKLRNKLRRIPGVADLRIAEPLDYPAFKVDVDRTKRSRWRNRTAGCVQCARRNLWRHAASAKFLARSCKRRQLRRHRSSAVSLDRFGRCDFEHGSPPGQ